MKKITSTEFHEYKPSTKIRHSFVTSFTLYLFGSVVILVEISLGCVYPVGNGI